MFHILDGLIVSLSLLFLVNWELVLRAYFKVSVFAEKASRVMLCVLHIHHIKKHLVASSSTAPDAKFHLLVKCQIPPW